MQTCSLRDTRRRSSHEGAPFFLAEPRRKLRAPENCEMKLNCPRQSAGVGDEEGPPCCRSCGTAAVTRARQDRVTNFTHMNPTAEHLRKLERMYHAAPNNRYYEPIIQISEGQTELTIPVKSDFFHAANAVHGSVYFKALDDSAFFAANSLVTDVFVLTVTYNVYFTRPISEGVLKAFGKVVHRSRNLFIAESEVFDSLGRQIGRGSGTFMRSQIHLTAEIGYV
jgi:uncharacterized protein (TIGR00369 family)